MSRTVLITGAAQRIGAAIAGHLADDGWSIAVHYNTSQERAEEVCEDLRLQGVEAQSFQSDLADEAAVREMVADVMASMAPLAAVINNASVFEVDDITTRDSELWDLHMAVNVRAPYVLSQALAESLMRESVNRVDNACIVNIIDQRVFNPTPHLISYSLSKMALWDQTQVLARALAPRIRVNGVGPGPVLPGPRQDQEDFDLQASQTPLGQAVAPTEIAEAVAFLLNASSVTGQMIAVDSGQFMNWAFETDETKPRE